MIEQYHVRLKKLLQQGISNPEFYPIFSDLFKPVVKRNGFNKIGYHILLAILPAITKNLYM